MKNSRDQLSLPEREFTSEEYDRITARSLELLVAVENIYALVMTHKLNCHAAAPCDVTLWDEVEKLVSYEE